MGEPIAAAAPTAVAVADLDPEACLAPTHYVDADHPDVRAFAERVLAEAGVASGTDREKAVALFLAVRDGIRYDPYASTDEPAFRASAVSESVRNWCVPKSVLLTAACRAAGIPAALGFADVRNHLNSEKLRATMQTDLFAWHGYSVIRVDGAWRKVSSAFNVDLCRKFGTRVLEWDGTGDALMHPFDEAGNRHMEYVRDRGVYLELPLAEIKATFAEIYPSMPAGGLDEAGSVVEKDTAFE